MHSIRNFHKMFAFTFVFLHADHNCMCLLCILCIVHTVHQNAINENSRWNKKHTRTRTKWGFIRCDIGSPHRIHSLINLLREVTSCSAHLLLRIRLIQLPWTFQLWAKEEKNKHKTNKKNFRLEIIYTSGNFVGQNSAMVYLLAFGITTANTNFSYLYANYKSRKNQLLRVRRCSVFCCCDSWSRLVLAHNKFTFHDFDVDEFLLLLSNNLISS